MIIYNEQVKFILKRNTGFISILSVIGICHTNRFKDQKLHKNVFYVYDF